MVAILTLKIELHHLQLVRVQQLCQQRSQPRLYPVHRIQTCLPQLLSFQFLCFHLLLSDLTISKRLWVRWEQGIIIILTWDCFENKDRSDLRKQISINFLYSMNQHQQDAQGTSITETTGIQCPRRSNHLQEHRSGLSTRVAIEKRGAHLVFDSTSIQPCHLVRHRGLMPKKAHICWRSSLSPASSAESRKHDKRMRHICATIQLWTLKFGGLRKL